MKSETLREVIKAYQLKDINSQVNDLRNLVWVINRLVHALYEGKITPKPWNNYLEALSIRFSWGCCSLCSLAEGTIIRSHIEDKDIKYPDLPSIYITARAIVETYLVIYHINFEGKGNDERIFRNKLYVLSGLCQRQKFPTLTPEGKKKLQDEAIQIEELRTEIKANAYFQKLPVERQVKLLIGKDAKEIGFERLIERRGIKNLAFNMTWRLYSNYAHAEYIGVMQLPEYIRNKSELESSVHLAVTQIITVASLLIGDLISEFPAANIVYNTIKEEYRDKAEFWQDIALKAEPPV